MFDEPFVRTLARELTECLELRFKPEVARIPKMLAWR
jgi:hypothetical protein